MKIRKLFITICTLTSITACDEPETILLQKFHADGYSVTIQGYKESTSKSLRIRKGETTSIVQLKEYPAEIKKVGKDSILLEYFVFSSPQEITKYKSLNEGFVVVEHFNRVVGTLQKKEYNIDKVESNKNTLLFYSNGSLVDALDKNNLLYTGTYFFKREFDAIQHNIYSTKFLIQDKTFIREYVE